MLILDKLENKKLVSRNGKGVTRENQLHKLVVMDLGTSLCDLDRNLDYRIISKFSEKLPTLILRKSRVVYMENISGGTYFIFDHFSGLTKAEIQIKMLHHSLELSSLLSKNRHEEIIIYCNSNILSFKALEEIFSHIENVEFYGRLQRRFEHVSEKISVSSEIYKGWHDFNKRNDMTLLRFSPKNLRVSIDSNTVASLDFQGIVVLDSLNDPTKLREVCRTLNPRIIISKDVPTTEVNNILIEHSVYHKLI